jgi:hypothetical protein
MRAQVVHDGRLLAHLLDAAERSMTRNDLRLPTVPGERVDHAPPREDVAVGDDGIRAAEEQIARKDDVSLR